MLRENIIVGQHYWKYKGVVCLSQPYQKYRNLSIPLEISQFLEYNYFIKLIKKGAKTVGSGYSINKLEFEPSKKYIAKIFKEIEKRIYPYVTKEVYCPFSFSVEFLDGAQYDGSMLDTENSAPAAIYSQEIPFSLKKSAKNDYCDYVCNINVDCTKGPYALFFTSYFIDELARVLRKIIIDQNGEYFMNPDFSFYSDTGIKTSYARASERIYQDACNQMRNDFENAFGISFNVVQLLSFQKYEKEDADGNLLFALQQQTPKMDWRISSASSSRFPKKIKFCKENIRLIGKFLAGAKSHGLLFVFNQDSSQPPLLKGVIDSRNCPPPLLQVRISSQANWSVLINDLPLFESTPEYYILPQTTDKDSQENIIKRFIASIIKKEFWDVSPHVDFETAAETIMAVGKQTHGAAVIVAQWTDNPKLRDNLSRLIKNAQVVPVRFSTIVPSLTEAAKMDGAVLLDLNKKPQVIAINTIVDGRSCLPGVLDRGSRYNSIRNFIADNSILCDENIRMAGFVFSSDGGMDSFMRSKLMKKILKKA